MFLYGILDILSDIYLPLILLFLYFHHFCSSNKVSMIFSFSLPQCMKPSIPLSKTNSAQPPHCPFLLNKYVSFYFFFSYSYLERGSSLGNISLSY